MVKKSKSICEQPDHFSFTGRVVHSKSRVERRTGGMVSLVVVENASHTESQAFDIYNDYGGACERGQWVTISYHWDKQNNNIVDNHMAFDPLKPVSAEQDGLMDGLIGLGDLLTVSMAKSDLLMMAVSAGSIDSADDARRLIASGADVERCDAMGQTPAMIAAASDRADCLELLVKAGADINKCSFDGMTPAMWAASTGNEACLESLVAAGADLGRARRDGRTAAMLAARHGQEACLRALMDHGVDLSAVDRLGKTAGDHARESGHAACAEAISARELARDERVALASATAGRGSSPTAPSRARSL